MINDPLLSENMDTSRRNFRQTISSLLGIVVISLLIVTAFSGPVAAHTGDSGVHHHDGAMGTHDGMADWMVGGVGFLWMILWTVMLIGMPVVLVYFVLTRRGSTDGAPDDDALALLRQRYAQGEINEEEFETRREQLRRDVMR